jgi:hypothetical protein
MSEWGDIISRIFSTGRTQGLSGSAEAVLDPDPASGFYASRLRKHRTEGDLVADPNLLWTTPSFGGRKGGLLAHVASERSEGVASYTDILVVVNQDDAKRAAAWNGGEPWAERAGGVVSASFDRFCIKEGFHLPFQLRPLRFWFVADGSRDMLSQSFGLEPGEFATGLLPNLYIGPASTSRPVLSIHLNLPGVWDGYKEVGRLYNDQLLYTLGRHWLDNYHHAALKEPGIYRLQQFANGTLVHEVSPELQDRYMVRSDKVDGASVITVAERSGRPVAYLVLAVIEAGETTSPGGALGPNAQASAEFAAKIPKSPGLPETRSDTNRKTVVPTESQQRVLTLQERGALLQKVHFGGVMEGYDVYIGSNGQMATLMPSPRATIQVRGRRVQLLSQSEGVRLGDRVIPVGTVVPMQGEMRIEVDGHPLEYRDLADVSADGWPYLAEVRRPGAGTYLEFGEAVQIGRDRRCKVRLPDEPHNDNISWLPSVDNGTTITSRNGQIPKSRFYTDSIMVASEHLEIDLAGEPVARSKARQCYSFVRRGSRILPLFPREGNNGVKELPLEAGDELLVGNCLFQATWPPRAEAASRAAPARPPNFLAAIELPSAKMLGEKGPPPKRMQLDTLSQDSISFMGARPVQPKKLEPVPPPPALLDISIEEDPVVAVEEAWCKTESSRPGRLVQVGWVIGPELVVGNNRDAGAVIPELATIPDQPFMKLDYFKIRVNPSVQVELLQPGEARLTEGGAEVQISRQPLACRMWVTRRDADFEPDFDVELMMASMAGLPTGRSWVLQVDLSRPRVAALFTTGVSVGQSRQVRLNSLDCTITFDGKGLTIANYTGSLADVEGGIMGLATGDGKGPMKPFPGDGSGVVLNPGNTLLVAGHLFRFQVGG